MGGQGGWIVRRLTATELDRYDHVPVEVAARVRVVVVPVLAPGTGAMTLDRLVLVRRHRRDDAALLAHELVHARQWAELGITGFLRRYLGSYLANLARHRRHHAAYLAIPLEREARDGAVAWARDHGDRGGGRR